MNCKTCKYVEEFDEYDIGKCKRFVIWVGDSGLAYLQDDPALDPDEAHDFMVPKDFGCPLGEEV